MPNFTYTHAYRVDSSAVNEAYYNENTKELAVDLHDEVYVYPGVPLSRYEAMVDADSVGRAFREVKLAYGPSEYLGYVTDVNYVPESAKAQNMAAVGTPKGLTYAPDAVVTDNTNGNRPVDLFSGQRDQYEIELTFNVELGRSRTYTTTAASLDEAVEGLDTALSALGLEGSLEKAVVYYV